MDIGVFNLASEVEFDLGGHRSNLTSEVKVYSIKFVPIMLKNQHAKFGFNM